MPHLCRPPIKLNAFLFGIFFDFLALIYKPKKYLNRCFLAFGFWKTKTRIQIFWLPNSKNQKSTYLGTFWLISQSQKGKKKTKQTIE
jgi:hypothetical protein